MNFSIDNFTSLKGKTAIVTGANTGLGYETALAFAKKEITVIMACRTESRAMAACEKIKSKVPKADLEFIPLDLSDLASVREFNKLYRNNHKKLDILINNAGIMIPPYELTVDGFESQMGANYFGHFLLTSLLLDLFPDTSESRIVSLSSNAHKGGLKKINFDDLHWEQKYSRMNAYCQSKLACLIFGNELNRRLNNAGKKILSVSAHPGISSTELGRHISKKIGMLLQYTIIPLITHPIKDGALPQIMAALLPNAKGGDYYGPTGFKEMKGPPGKASMMDYAKDEDVANKLWTLSEELTNADYGILN